MGRFVPPPAKPVEEKPAPVAFPPREEARAPSYKTVPEPSFRLANFIGKKLVTPVKPSGNAGPKSAAQAAPATPERSRPGIAWVTEARRPVVKEWPATPAPEASEQERIPPPADKNLFRLNDLLMKKQAASLPKPVPKPAPMPVPKPAPMPALEPAPAPLPAGTDSPRLAEKVFAAAPRSTGDGRATLNTQRASASATLKKAANASRYEEAPVGIYAICRQFGIAMPNDKTAALEQARACLATFFKKILLPAPEQYMIWPMIKSIAADIDGIITADASVLSILHRYRTKEEKLVWHSIYTAILAMDLSRHMENLYSSMHEIGGAALLHDAGFLIQTTANGFDNIPDQASPEFREHIDKSVELARRIEAPDAVVTMIAQHHGRLDGHGFPPGLSHGTFPRSSQILAIASIFEHAVLDLAMEKKDATNGNADATDIAKVFVEYRNGFDIDLLKKMIALIGFYPVDSIVELNNHAICKVVRQNNDFPLRPVVQVVMDGIGMHPEHEKLIDLKEIKVLSVLRTIANLERKTKQE